MTIHNPTQIPTINIIGAGRFGTALAWLLGEKGYPVTLTCLDPQQAQTINHTHLNSSTYPQLKLPLSVHAVSLSARSMLCSDVLILAVPAQAVRQLTQHVAAHPPKQFILNAAKGIEETTGLRVSQIIAQEFGTTIPYAVVSGPNFAQEIIQKIPTVTVVAADDRQVVETCQTMLNTTFFRIYGSTDVIGVELGGILKNILAIAAGIHDGLDLGANSKAALIVRGIVEISRFAVRLGAQSATIMGISGLGDITLSCYSPLSRNYQLGYKLATGIAMEEAVKQIHSTIEGIHSTPAILKRAQELAVEMPITQAVADILAGRCDPHTAIQQLMDRPWKFEVA